MEAVHLLRTYINYPNPHATLHGDPGCAQIRKMRKADQRVVRIDPASFCEEIGKMKTSGFRFAAEPSMNDVWLSIDFDDPTFEEGVATYVLKVLARRYRPLKGVVPKRHC